MECLVEARTERAGVCVFDAASLPPEADHAEGEAAARMREALSREGKAWFARTPGNGAWPIVLRVDEGGAVASAGAPVHRGRLAVPTGKLWVCGAEFLARDPAAGSARTPDGGLARHPMGDCIDVPAGVYELSVFAHDASTSAALSPAQSGAQSGARTAAPPSTPPVAAAATTPPADAPRSRRRQVAWALGFGGLLAGGIGVASAAWTLYALWIGDTDENWQSVLRQNVPAILAFLVVALVMLYVGRVLDGFESARALAEPQPAAAPAYTLVLSRIGRPDGA